MCDVKKQFGINKSAKLQEACVISCYNGVGRIKSFLLPGGLQTHLLCRLQVQTALVLALAIPRLLFTPSTRCPSPITVSETNTLFCNNNNAQYRFLFTSQGFLVVVPGLPVM
jgi:hypothetical protein